MSNWGFALSQHACVPRCGRTPTLQGIGFGRGTVKNRKNKWNNGVRGSLLCHLSFGRLFWRGYAWWICVFTHGCCWQGKCRCALFYSAILCMRCFLRKCNFFLSYSVLGKSEDFSDVLGFYCLCACIPAYVCVCAFKESFHSPEVIMIMD